MRFLFDVLQAFTPVITWTSLLGDYYFHFFPRIIRVNHFIDAWTGESSVTSDVASEEDDLFVLVIAVMVFMWIVMLYCLDDTYKLLKKCMFCSAGSALCEPYRLHVHASTLVWVAVKLFILFGRPLGLYSSTMATHDKHEWPQIVVCMFFYDTLLNCMWACQLVVGSLAPVLAGKRCFKYYTQIVLETHNASKEQTQPGEFFVVEEEIQTYYLSSWREEEVVCNSLACKGIPIEQPEHTWILQDLFAHFSTATCEEASVYTQNGKQYFRVGCAHAEHTENEARKKKESYRMHQENIAEIAAARKSHTLQPSNGPTLLMQSSTPLRQSSTPLGQSSASQPRGKSPVAVGTRPRLQSLSYTITNMSAGQSSQHATPPPTKSSGDSNSQSAPQTPATSPNTFFSCVLGAVINYLRSVQDSTSVGTE